MPDETPEPEEEADYRIGFDFGDPAGGDRLLNATLPDGWTREAIGHDMHTPPLHASCRCHCMADQATRPTHLRGTTPRPKPTRHGKEMISREGCGRGDRHPPDVRRGSHHLPRIR